MRSLKILCISVTENGKNHTTGNYKHSIIPNRFFLLGGGVHIH
jgi:hypothetical protein